MPVRTFYVPSYPEFMLNYARQKCGLNIHRYHSSKLEAVSSIPGWLIYHLREHASARSAAAILVPVSLCHKQA